MKTFITVLVAAFSMLVFTGVAAAANTAVKTTGSGHAVKRKMSLHFTGEVLSVNQEAKTLTVKNITRGREREKTFRMGADAVSKLANLKAGDRVRVSYVRTGGQLTAETIVKSDQHTAKK